MKLNISFCAGTESYVERFQVFCQLRSSAKKNFVKKTKKPKIMNIETFNFFLLLFFCFCYLQC